MRGAAKFSLLFLLLFWNAELPASDILLETLPNGLTVCVKENHSAPVVSIRVYVKTGSIYEGEYLGVGISHLLEHLVHGGTTTKRTEDESRRLLQSIGNASNAATSWDYTCYFISTMKDYFDIANDLLADWIQNCRITKKEFERELGVVQREIEKGEGEPTRKLMQLFAGTMFQVHPCRYPVIGYKELLSKVTRQEVIDYYHKMYAPNNVIVVAVGDFDAREVLRKIKEKYINFPRRRCVVPVLPEEPPQLGERYAEIEMDVKSAYMMLGFRTVPISHPDLYPLDVMSYILSRGESSRLVKTIKNDKQLVHSIASWSFTPRYDGGMFVVQCLLDEDKLEPAREAILQELYKLRTKPVTKEELEKAKRQKVADDIFSRQTVEDEAADIGMNLLTTGNPDFSRIYLENIKKVTAEQIMNAARKYFREDRLCVAVVRPRKKVAAARKKVKETPKTTARKFVLPNGLRLIAKYNPTAPIVVMQAYFLGGVRFENKSNNGVFRLMSSLLVKGTKTRTADDIAREFDRMGGSISSSSGRNTFFCTATVMKEDFPKAFDIFADVIRNPVFDETELEKARKLMLASITRRYDRWDSAGYCFFIKNFFRKSPYGLLPDGEMDSVKSLTRDDVVKLHRKYCVANNMVLAIFGDIKPEEAFELTKQKFSSMRRDDSFSPPSVPREPPLQSIRKVQKRFSGDQAVIYLGFPGMSLTDIDDRFPMMVIDAAISGIGYPTGWLHEELRGRGLVYVVHAYNWTGLGEGYFAIYAACPPEKVDEVVGIILKCIERVKREGLTDEEFERAKRMCISEDKLSKQRNSAQAMEAALDELYGLGYDFPDKFADRIRKVSKDDILHVARKYFRNYVLTVLSPTAEEK